MKIIQSFFLITVCLCATNLLHAQEAKTTPVKPIEVKTIQAPTVQPGSTATPQAATENTKPAPSDEKNEGIKTPAKEKIEFRTVEAKPVTELKKEPAAVQPLITPNTNTVKPVPVQKSVVKEQ
jgi:hypothetical protein